LIYARLTRTVPVGTGRIPAARRPAGAQEALVGDQLEEPASARVAAQLPAKPRASLPGVLEPVQSHLTSIPGD
jgi:hypothetical protein